MASPVPGHLSRPFTEGRRGLDRLKLRPYRHAADWNETWRGSWSGLLVDGHVSTGLAAARTRELVEKVASVSALVVRQGAGLRLLVPDVGALARHLREALSPTAVQLCLPYLRL